MADKIEYSRLLIKRSDNSGVIPTIPTGSTLSTFTDTDTFVGEFFLNSTDDRLWVRTDNGQYEIMMSGNTSGNTQNLGQTLVYGNTTDGNDIVISNGDRIESLSGNSYIQFDKVGNEILQLISLGVSGQTELGLNQDNDLTLNWADGVTLGGINIDNNFLELEYSDGTEESKIEMSPSVLNTTSTFGNIKSQMILDPEQAVNGTQLRTEDMVNGDFGLFLAREGDILIETYNTSQGASSSYSMDGLNTQIQSKNIFYGESGIGVWTKTETIGTTGNSPTTIITIDTGTAPFGNNKIYRVEGIFTGLDDTYTSGFTTQCIGTFRNNGGTLTQIGVNEYVGTRNEFTGLTDPDIYSSGDEIRGRVRGLTGKNITWSVVFHIYHYG